MHHKTANAQRFFEELYYKCTDNQNFERDDVNSYPWEGHSSFIILFHKDGHIMLEPSYF